MDINTDIFKIETNHVLPSRGKVLISEPFLYDEMFGRSIILLVDHTLDGTMGLVLNKSLPLYLNDVLKDFKDVENIPIYKGGPLCTDTLFYLHTLKGVKDSLQIGKGFYLNGDFDAIRRYIWKAMTSPEKYASSWDIQAGNMTSYARKLKKTPG